MQSEESSVGNSRTNQKETGPRHHPSVSHATQNFSTSRPSSDGTPGRSVVFLSSASLMLLRKCNHPDGFVG